MTDDRRSRPRAEPFKTFATMTRGGGLVELRCRRCQTVIAKKLPVGEQKVHRVKNQTFVETTLEFTYLANYREVEIQVEGGKHVGNVCSTCAPALSDPAVLERFCETDLAQWRSEGHKITAKMDRRPVKVLRVADQIKD